MIGTSDQSCWLAEACKILLVLLFASLTTTCEYVFPITCWHMHTRSNFAINITSTMIAGSRYRHNELPANIPRVKATA